MEKTLLLVDDEVSVLKSLQRLFRRAGYTVYTAEGAVEALMILADHPISVVLSDFRMPGMTGDELLQEVKKQYPDTVRMILSGFADMESVMASLNDGAIFKFLVKPWDNDFLLRQMEEAFEHGRQLQDQKALSRLALGAEEALFDVDSEGRVIHLTPSAAQHCGWTPEDARGQLLSDLLPAMTELEQILLLHPDGSRLSLRNAQGRPIELHSTRTDGGHWTLKLSSQVSETSDSAYALGIEGMLDDAALQDTLLQLSLLNDAPAFALIYLNIDHYADLTGQLSARELDELRYQIGQMLMLWRHTGGAVAWLGQDEFVLLIQGVRTDVDIRRRISEQLAPFNAPLTVGEHSLAISFNVGFAIYPDDAADVDLLRNHARLALKHSRRRGSKYCPRFQHRMALDDTIQRELVDDFYYAVERNELVVCYQPEVHLLDGHVTAADACVGWLHPEFGLITPEQLYPIIEQCDLAEPLLEWLQVMAGTQCEIWAIEGLTTFPVQTALLPQPTRADLPECLVRCQSMIAMPESGWAIQLSEALLLIDAEESLQLLPTLKDAGWQLMIDTLQQGSLLHSTVRHGEQYSGNAQGLLQAVSRDQLSALAMKVNELAHPDPDSLILSRVNRNDISAAEAHRLTFVTPWVTAERMRAVLERQPLVSISTVLSMEEELV